jgi:hypothetical protein
MMIRTAKEQGAHTLTVHNHHISKIVVGLGTSREGAQLPPLKPRSEEFEPAHSSRATRIATVDRNNLPNASSMCQGGFAHSGRRAESGQPTQPRNAASVIRDPSLVSLGHQERERLVQLQMPSRGHVSHWQQKTSKCDYWWNWRLHWRRKLRWPI